MCCTFVVLGGCILINLDASVCSYLCQHGNWKPKMQTIWLMLFSGKSWRIISISNAWNFFLHGIEILWNRQKKSFIRIAVLKLKQLPCNIYRTCIILTKFYQTFSYRNTLSIFKKNKVPPNLNKKFCNFSHFFHGLNALKTTNMYHKTTAI